MISAIIVAGGSSRRMGFDKLTAPLCGKPVVWYSIRAFAEAADFDEIIVVTREDRVAEFEAIVADVGAAKPIRVVAGGAERHLSVWNGLQSIAAEESEFVAIHDGARPLITPELVSECLDAARKHHAACCAAPIPDTVKRSDAKHHVTESVERNNLWAMQTPQIFASGLILQAYAALMAQHETVTDEISAVQRLGKRPFLLQSEEWNFKITFPRDLELAAHVLELRAKKNPSAG